MHVIVSQWPKISYPSKVTIAILSAYISFEVHCMLHVQFARLHMGLCSLNFRRDCKPVVQWRQKRLVEHFYCSGQPMSTRTICLRIRPPSIFLYASAIHTPRSLTLQSACMTTCSHTCRGSSACRKSWMCTHIKKSSLPTWELQSIQWCTLCGWLCIHTCLH